MFNLPHRKEKPILSMQSMGGGAVGGLVAGGAPPNIEASGGTKTTPGDGYVYHFMTGGQFQVTEAGDGPDAVIDICLVGGGGGGGNDRGGGGGGGGFRITTYDVSTTGAGNYACSVGSGGPSGGTSGPLGNRPRAQNGNPSYFQMTPTTKIEVGGGGGGGGANEHPTSVSPTFPKNYGHPGTPSPFPTDPAPTHTNTTVYPGSGGGAIASTNNGGGSGAGSDFNSSPGARGYNNEDVGAGRGGGGGGAGSTYSPTNTTGDGGVGKQLPWALPTWGWGQNDDSSTPGGYGWFAGGAGGGSDPQEFCPNSRMGRSGGGRGGCPTTPYGNGAPGTGGGGGSKGAPGGTAGTGGSGAIMIRYPAP